MQGRFSLLCELIRVPSRAPEHAVSAFRTHDFGTFRRVVRVIWNVIPPSTPARVFAHYEIRGIGEDGGYRNCQPSWTRSVRLPKPPSNCFVYASTAYRAVREGEFGVQQQLMNTSSPSCDAAVPATYVIWELLIHVPTWESGRHGSEPTMDQRSESLTP